MLIENHTEKKRWKKHQCLKDNSNQWGYHNLFFHSPNKYWLNVYHVPGTLVSAENTEKNSCIPGASILSSLVNNSIHLTCTALLWISINRTKILKSKIEIKRKYAIDKVMFD